MYREVVFGRERNQKPDLDLGVRRVWTMLSRPESNQGKFTSLYFYFVKRRGIWVKTAMWDVECGSAEQKIQAMK